MANIQFTNFARSKLTVGISSSATSITITGATGVLFPSLTGGQYFYATLENASLVREIVKVTARATDTFTVVRAQDGTTAVAWNAGDTIALRFTAGAIADTLNSAAQQSSVTGTLLLPTGTTAQRFATVGIRYNTTTLSFEGYNGSVWGSIGGGATGGVGNAAFYENDQTITVDYTLTAGKNAGTFGPVTINTGVTVTVPTGATWSIV